MKRLLCCVLALCLLPITLLLGGCESDGFPETAQAKYTAVEGERIPFELLFLTVRNYHKSFVIRSELEAKTAWSFIRYDGYQFPNGAETLAEHRQMLLDVDYDKYTVVGIEVPISPCGEAEACRIVAEVMLQNGKLCAVADKEAIEMETGLMSGSYVSVIKVRKDDFDLPDCITPFDIPVTLYLGDKNDLFYAELVR